MGITVPQAERSVTEKDIPSAKVGQPSGEAFGKPLQRANEQAMAIARKSAKDANERAVLDADRSLAQLETDLMWHPDSGAMHTREVEATASYDTVTEAYSQQVENIESSLANDAQKQSFRGNAMNRFASMDLALKKHIASENRSHDDRVYTSGMSDAEIRATRYYDDPKEIDIAVRTQRALTADYAKRNGYDSKWVKRESEKSESGIHKAVIEQMMADNDEAGADKYYTENRAAIINDAKIKKQVKEAVIIGKSRKLVDDVWEKHGPEEDDDAVEIDKMYAEVTSKAKSEQERRLARTALRERKTIRDAAVKERSDANVSDIYNAKSDGATFMQVMKMPQYKSLSGQDKENVRDEYERDRASKAPTNVQWAEYWPLTDPDKLIEMTDNEIIAMTSKLGTRLTNNLMTLNKGTT